MSLRQSSNLILILAISASGTACLITTDENLWKKNPDSRADLAKADSPRPEQAIDGPALDLRPVEARVDSPGKDTLEPDTLKPDTLKPDTLKPDAFVSCPHPPVAKSCTSGWCSIPAGCFLMGSPTSEACRDATDELLHEVTLTHAFEIAETEVTQQEFYSLRLYKPSSNQICGNACPVETVTWHEAAAYCNALSASKSLAACYTCAGSPIACSEVVAYAGTKFYACPGYRLPTEAEWEYAYRAGTTASTYGGAITGCGASDTVATALGWYSGNSGNAIHAAKQKPENPWGLVDMAGNVYEWTNDWYKANLGSVKVSDPIGGPAGPDRVVKGGGFNRDAQYLRAASREPRAGTAYQDANIGFRCVRTK